MQRDQRETKKEGHTTTHGVRIWVGHCRGHEQQVKKREHQQITDTKQEGRDKGTGRRRKKKKEAKRQKTHTTATTLPSASGEIQLRIDSAPMTSSALPQMNLQLETPGEAQKKKKKASARGKAWVTKRHGTKKRREDGVGEKR